MLTHSNMSSNVMQIMQPGGTNLRTASSEYQDTYIGLMPLFHTYGITIILNTGLETGAKIVTLPQFEVQSYFNAIDTHKVINNKVHYQKQNSYLYLLTNSRPPCTLCHHLPLF